MLHINNIVYNEANTYEYRFDDFSVYLEPETHEVTRIRFKDEKGSFIKTPKGMTLRDRYGIIRDASREFQIFWNEDYTLEHNGEPILEVTCLRQQVINSKCLSYTNIFHKNELFYASPRRRYTSGWTSNAVRMSETG